MNANATKIRMLAAAAAIAIVGLTIAALGNYSDAKYQGAVVAANGYERGAHAQATLVPSRVDVVALRAPRTRTATLAAAPRPQS